MAFTLQLTRAGGFVLTALENLRTEIVLKDARDVAFWFSLNIQVQIFRKRETGQIKPPAVYYARARLNPLFPKRHDYGKGQQFRGGR